MLVKKLFPIAICAISFLSDPLVYAQDVHFNHYSAENGLPGTQVHDIIQDKYGYLWFSTDQGLSRYDGYQFKNYTSADGLTDNTVFKFFPQANGDIWCTTLNKSLFCIRGRAAVFKPYRFNKTLMAIPDNFVANCIFFSDEGSLFMSVINGLGYICIDSCGKTLHNSFQILQRRHETSAYINKQGRDFFFIHSTNQPGLSKTNWAYSISSKKNNTGGYVKACIFEKQKCAVFSDVKSVRIVKEGVADPIIIKDTLEPVSLGKLNDSLFWVGFRYGGGCIFDLSGKKIQALLSGKSVTKVLIDHEGGYWLSTLNDGVFHANNSSLSSYGSSETTDAWVHSLTKDESGALWMGLYNGDVAVLAKNKMTKKYTAGIKRPALISSDPVTNGVYFISDGKLFAGNHKTPLYDLKINPVNFAAHRNDSFIAAGYRNIYILHAGKKKEIYTQFRVNNICFHRDRFFLAGNKGLYEFHDQQIRRCTYPDVPVSKISDIASWGDKLLIAVEGNGLLIAGADTVYKIDKTMGLVNNLVNRIHIENDTTFWACTHSGLNRIVFKNGKVARIHIISGSEGLISNEITDVEIISDTVWVGTRKGLCSFPLSMLLQKKESSAYYFSIDCFKVNDRACAEKMSGNLEYDQNRIEFCFKAISFHESSPILYRYRLQGLEEKWNYTSGLSITYPSLPPGNYTFIVEARGAHADWGSERREFEFRIAPPFWKTGWFAAAVFVFVLAMVYLFFRFRILSYNRDISRELLRQLLKRLKKKTNYVVFKEQGKHIRIVTNDICFVKASGNYIEIQTDTKKFVTRYKIGGFLELVPDPLEYLRISRSSIVRLDKIQEKSKKEVIVRGEKIAVGETYVGELQKIQF
ncbi:MAG: hypothetical protein K0S33_1460 [Bacteroidetes bacterium]|nr:hypothetical protein [Bacteroidota bacterium]